MAFGLYSRPLFLRLNCERFVDIFFKPQLAYFWLKPEFGNSNSKRGIFQYITLFNTATCAAQRFRCVGRCWDWTQNCSNDSFEITGLYLIHRKIVWIFFNSEGGAFLKSLRLYGKRRQHANTSKLMYCCIIRTSTNARSTYTIRSAPASYLFYFSVVPPLFFLNEPGPMGAFGRFIYPFSVHVQRTPVHKSFRNPFYNCHCKKALLVSSCFFDSIFYYYPMYNIEHR